MNAFPDKLILEDVESKNGTQIFKLKSPFAYISKQYGRIVVPAGFETDGISIPKIFWSIIGPTSKAFKISVVHDYLFSKQCKYNFTNKEADKIMLEGMKVLGVPLIERTLIYKALQLFSWIHFKRK